MHRAGAPILFYTYEKWCLHQISLYGLGDIRLKGPQTECDPSGGPLAA